MKVLFLGNIGSPLIEILKSFGEEVVSCSIKLNLIYIDEVNPDYIVSYGYPFIVKKDVIHAYRERIINLHISYLPWNRGSDPELWSLVDNTPKGVSIHYMDAGIDTGDLIVQYEVVCKPDDTLSDYYDRLHETILELFKENWSEIKTGSCQRMTQQGEGSYHKSVDKEMIVHLVQLGEKTPIASIISVS
ncbi:MAG: formyl transferase [Bacteroidetes bacterium]|nr:MAG: formyl transferase [Bacteroidota bacterium]